MSEVEEKALAKQAASHGVSKAAIKSAARKAGIPRKNVGSVALTKPR